MFFFGSQILGKFCYRTHLHAYNFRNISLGYMMACSRSDAGADEHIEPTSDSSDQWKEKLRLQLRRAVLNGCVYFAWMRALHHLGSTWTLSRVSAVFSHPQFPSRCVCVFVHVCVCVCLRRVLDYALLPIDRLLTAVRSVWQLKATHHVISKPVMHATRLSAVVDWFLEDFMAFFAADLVFKAGYSPRLASDTALHHMLFILMSGGVMLFRDRCRRFDYITARFGSFSLATFTSSALWLLSRGGLLQGQSLQRLEYFTQILVMLQRLCVIPWVLLRYSRREHVTLLSVPTRMPYVCSVASICVQALNVFWLWKALFRRRLI